VNPQVEQHINTLIEMGFTEDQARLALHNARKTPNWLSICC
jgi:Holliday junction resolvasome RuvABC DNA-binding subunit